MLTEFDLSGNGHDPEWVDGKFGKALKFGGEGSDVFVTVQSTPILNVNECTFMAWVNAEHWDGTRQIVGKSVHGCSGRTQYGLFSESGVFKLRFETESGRADISTDLPPAGEWVHVITSTLTAKVLYRNANDDPWRIGQDCERLNYVFAGLIMRLWNRALSAEDVAALKDLPTAVDARSKLATTWGNIKSDR